MRRGYGLRAAETQAMNRVSGIISAALRGERVAPDAALALATCDDLGLLSAAAGRLRDQGHGSRISYSPKVFIPLTQLCRDVCHYCTFAQTPKKLAALRSGRGFCRLSC